MPSVPTLFLSAPTSLLPVALFLVALLLLDSYKLVRIGTVVVVIGAGAALAGTALFANPALQDALDLGLQPYSRYASPLLEECLKALVVLWLMRTHRIVFMVDAAILGFAAGAGFAWFENLYFLYTVSGTQIGVWVVRGLGTAIMHGGATALFGMLACALTSRSVRIEAHRLLPGLAAAVLLHSLFNHFPGTPVLTALGTFILVPLALVFAFERGARRMGEWLRADFDADTELLAQIVSPEFSTTAIGRYLQELRTKFEGPVVGDMLCYLRVYTELAIRAKGLLLAREAGLEIPPDETTRAQFEELAFLERSIGPTGLLAMRPFLVMERADLWQLKVLQG